MLLWVIYSDTNRESYDCSFNRFDFAPIFHRDEDTNLDELRVSTILFWPTFVFPINGPIIWCLIWFIFRRMLDSLYLLYYDFSVCLISLHSVTVEDNLFLEKTLESKSKKNHYYQITPTWTRYASLLKHLYSFESWSLVLHELFKLVTLK